jgi:hypothetical protein
VWDAPSSLDDHLPGWCRRLEEAAKYGQKFTGLAVGDVSPGFPHDLTKFGYGAMIDCSRDMEIGV